MLADSDVQLYGRVVQHIRLNGYDCIFSELHGGFETVLRANGVITDTDTVIPKLENAIEFAETELLQQSMGLTDLGAIESECHTSFIGSLIGSIIA